LRWWPNLRVAAGYHEPLGVLMNNQDLARIVQIAMIGAVPPTLRFLYASYENEKFRYHAVFTDEATEDHLECGSCILTEIYSAFSHNPEEEIIIEKNSNKPWKINEGRNLLYLRYGELENT